MVIEKTGWTRQYVLWGIPWINCQIGLADAPSVKKRAIKKKKLSGKEAIALRKAKNTK